MKEKLKNTTGITLVALVITIIILLILATVTIRLVLSEGIIKRAENAVNSYNTAQSNELAQINNVETKMEQFGPKTLDPDWWKLTEEQESQVMKEDVTIGIAMVNSGDKQATVVIAEFNIRILIIVTKDYMPNLLIYVPEEYLEIFRQINSTYDAVGWYTTPDGSDFKRDVKKYTGPSPIQLSDFDEGTIWCESYLKDVIASF